MRFDTDSQIDPRREAAALHEVCSMTNGDKTDAQLMRLATYSSRSCRGVMDRATHKQLLAVIGL